MGKQILNFVVIIFSSIIIAGIYGILHDQITFSISNEYYTLFKFEQFNLLNSPFTTRVKVGIVGFLATWWVGLFLGIIYAVISLFLNKNKVLKVTIKSIILNLIVAFIFGFIGYLYGILFLTMENLNWYIPLGTRDIQNFINVGSIHNFGYIGGITGLIAGIYHQIKYANKNVA